MKTTEQCFVQAYEKVKTQLPGQAQDWLLELRRHAIDSFRQQGLPTRKNEAWKYTSLFSLTQTDFQFAAPEQSAMTLADIEQYLLAVDGYRLVFIDGLFQAELSESVITDDIYIGSLKQVIEHHPQWIQEYLGTGEIENGIQALNAALLQEGGFIKVAKNQVVEKPIQLVFISSQNEVAQTLKNIIVTGENSQVSVIENYIGANDISYFTNSSTEIFASPSSKVSHYKCQRDSQKGHHIANIKINQSEYSEVKCFSFCLGGQLVRSDTTSVLDAEGVVCELDGLYIGRGKDHIDNHTALIHAKPNTKSRECYKGILTDQSHAVFNGKIFVERNAQKTDAELSNKNLLLSRQAQIDTKPELEIFADDVKCSHGATVGQLDNDQLFYLRSRGIDQQTAKQLLLHAFAKDIVERIENKMIKQAIETVIETSLQAIAE